MRAEGWSMFDQGESGAPWPLAEKKAPNQKSANAPILSHFTPH